MNIYISHAGHYDYEAELYRPIQSSTLFTSHHFFLPHELENAHIAAKDELRRTDMLVAEVSYPSTGQGVELGLASAAKVPIVCFYRAGSKPSSSLHFLTDQILEYKDTEDLLAKLTTLINKD